MISHKHRCIFIHIPKCAGTSIELMLGHHSGRVSGAVDHRSVRMYERPIPPRAFLTYANVTDLARRAYYRTKKHDNTNNLLTVSAEQYRSYFKFSIVRNPWARAYSWYTNVLRFEQHRRRLGIGTDLPFSHFLERFAGKSTLRPQLAWLQDFSGTIPLDFIGTVETLEHDVSFIARRLRITNEPLQRLRDGKTGDYRPHYNEDSAELISRIYREEIALFGYRFDEPDAARSWMGDSSY